MPYHDSYTFSIYLNDYDRADIQEKIFEQSKSENYFIGNIYSGSIIPPISVSMFEKLKSFLRHIFK